MVEFDIGPDELGYDIEHGDVLLSVQLVLADEHTPVEAAQRAWLMVDEDEPPARAPAPRTPPPAPVAFAPPPTVVSARAPVVTTPEPVARADLRGSAWLPSSWQPTPAPTPRERIAPAASAPVATSPAPIRQVPPPSPTPRQLIAPTKPRVVPPPVPAPAPERTVAAPPAPPAPSAPPASPVVPITRVPEPAPVPVAGQEAPRPKIDAPVVVIRPEHDAKPPADLGLIDPVTGAGTVRALRRDVAAARSWDLPDVAPPAVIAIDLEPIPEIRRQVGDEAADRLLRAVVETIPWVLRARDRVYRIGPDDLALLMPSTGAEGVEAALVRLLRSIPTALSERGLVEVSLVPRPLDPATMEKGPPVWLDLPSEESETDPEPDADSDETVEGDPAPVAI